MRQPESFTCDICGAQKRETNHWWLLTTATLLVNSDGMPAPKEVRELRISQWCDELAINDQAKHACGQGCAQKLLERWMATGSLDAPRRPVAESVNA